MRKFPFMAIGMVVMFLTSVLLSTLGFTSLFIHFGIAIVMGVATAFIEDRYS